MVRSSVAESETSAADFLLYRVGVGVGECWHRLRDRTRARVASF